MIIGISGKIGSGKDTVGKIIQILTSPSPIIKDTLRLNSIEYMLNTYHKNIFSDNELDNFDWEIKKFAGKLKQIVSIITGISVEDLEKQEVKDRVLGDKWMVHHWNRQKLFLNFEDAVKYHGDLSPMNIKSEYLTPRVILQLLDTECGKDIIHPNIWVNALFADYNNLCKNKCQKQTLGNPEQCTCKEDCIGESSNWIITDVRFPNELEAVKERNGISIRVNRLLSEGNRPYVELHPSETALDNAKFDYVIDNNGTIEELTEKVKQILIKEKII